MFRILSTLLFAHSFLFTQAQANGNNIYQWLEETPAIKGQYSADIIQFYRSQNRLANKTYFNADNKTYQSLIIRPSELPEAQKQNSLGLPNFDIALFSGGKNARIEITDAEGKTKALKVSDLQNVSGPASTLLINQLNPIGDDYVEILLSTQGAITYYEWRLIDLNTVTVSLSLSNLRWFPNWNSEFNEFEYHILNGEKVFIKKHIMGESLEQDTVISEVKPPESLDFKYSFPVSSVEKEGSLVEVIVSFMDNPHGEILLREVANLGQENEKETTKTLVPSRKKAVLGRVSVDTKKEIIFSKYHWGAKQWAEFHDYTGQKIHEIEMPVGLSISAITWETGTAIFYLTSINGRHQINYDLENKKWFTPQGNLLNDDDFLKLTMQIEMNGKIFRPVVEVIETATHDSKQKETIPSLLIYLPESLIKEKAPTLIEFYGGFNLNYFDQPTLNSYKLDFLARGGMLVISGLRGGIEKGAQWHKDATFDKKINSAMDLISVAKDLVKRGYTKSKNIAISGGSNGGLVTGSALVLSPESFGLAIPVNGVMNVAKSYVLDASFVGWAYEYGNPIKDTEIAKAMSEYGPFSLIEKRQYPATLVFVGLTDDRVNPANSFKFVAKLQANQTGDAPILMTAIKNAGHGLKGSHHHGIRQAFNARFWTMIYETIF